MDETKKSTMQWYVGIALSLLGILLTIYFSIGSNKKELSYGVLTKTIFTSGEDGIKGLKIYLNDKDLIDSELVTIKIINSGSYPIEANDFEGPIEIKSDKDSKILSAEINKLSPVNLNVKLNYDENKIKVISGLLNPGDFFYVRCIVDKLDSDYIANARISGIKEIAKIDVRGDKKLRANIIAVFVLLFGVSCYILGGDMLTGKFRKKDVSINLYGIVLLTLTPFCSTLFYYIDHLKYFDIPFKWKGLVYVAAVYVVGRIITLPMRKIN